MSAPELTLLHRDEDVVAVDKPVGLAAIPEGPADTTCLQHLLSVLLNTRIWVVHRIDKDVSGVMLYALNAESHRRLNAQFENRAVRKQYLALLHGRTQTDGGDIRRAIREFGSGRMGVDDAKGKPCHTRWRVRERREGTTLVEAEPHTGRRHQLRVHFYSIGHAIVGDPRYGDKAVQATFPRLLLHSERIDYFQRDGSPRRVVSPVPAEFGLSNPTPV